ncbi:hypothetical protein AVEN_35436-1 [Araneus ventricosus]|uniref:Uncharacterized protein n=1 Tax=Araneus ventricosus TaxID=182803 RepID=A0A4Y2WLF5_ARAVE|nr:hypothetical protein AVEN_35436-1 [Araneus ventricosus]
MMMIGSSVDYIRSSGMRNVPVTKAVEHLYATTAKFSGCVFLASRPANSYPPRRLERYFRTDLVILNHTQMSRMTPELSAPSPNIRTKPDG